ncbi:MAG: geranylgeranylglyceryl/heptaprenylglyceryl phosphate synthase [Desulfurococcales archaeon]|nr:geranylgeranylglyceryl/heptaprenylglyceryl phosphate synthase [Desulfurococcales archaeon]
MGRVLSLLFKRRVSSRLHFTLIDPHKTGPEDAAKVASIAEDSGSDAILVGGSIGVYEPRLSNVVAAIKASSGLPVILFPGSIAGLTPKADAVLFMYLMNSDETYYITGAQAQASLVVLEMGLEPIPTAYIIVGYGGDAGYIGKARVIPYEKKEIVAAYALAGAMMGARLVYLEAGSGAPRPVPEEAVGLAKSLLAKARLETLLVVGGGVRTPDVAEKLARAGADVLVTGNITEEDPGRLASIVDSFKSV